MWRLSFSIGIFLMLFASIVSLVLFLVAPELVRWLGPDLSIAGRQVAVDTMRIITSTIPFIVGGVMARSVFESLQNFWQGFLPGILRSTFVVLAVVSVGTSFGVLSIAYGIALSQIVSFVLLIVLLIKHIPRSIMIRNLIRPQMIPEIRDLGWALIPNSLALGIYQIYTLIDRQMGTALPEGVISTLNYAYVLMLVPHSLIGMSISTLIYPSLTYTLSQQDKTATKRLVMRGARLIFLLSLPVSLLILHDAQILVKLVYERGQFSANDSLVTGVLLQEYAVFFILLGFVSIVARTLSAIRDGTGMMFVAITAIVVKIVVSSVLISFWGASAMVVGTGFSLVVYTILGYLIIVKRMGIQFFEPNDIKQVAIIALAGIFAMVFSNMLISRTILGQIEAVPQFVIYSISFTFTYVSALVILRSQDVIEFWKKLNHILRNRK